MFRGLIAVAITALLGAWSFLAWFGLGLAQAGSPLAVELPFNQATAARRQLMSGSSPLTKEQRDELALVALRRAPLSAQPLAYLALLAEQAGKEGSTRFLIDAARLQGWHDEAVQRILYNWAASGNDNAQALLRAEAMLRQNLASEDLTRDFARKGTDPVFRAAMVAMVSKDGAWADSWAGFEAPKLDDASLGALVTSPQFRQARSAQSLSILAAELVRAGRARLAWKLAHGDPGSRPLRLDWQPAADFPASDVFGWQIPASYVLVQDDAAHQQVRRQDAAPAQPLRILLGLTPGRYKVSFPGAGAAAMAGWRGGLTCGSAAAAPATPAGTDMVFTVDAACQQQVLSIAADIGVSAPLPAPVVQRLGD